MTIKSIKSMNLGVLEDNLAGGANSPFSTPLKLQGLGVADGFATAPVHVVGEVPGVDPLENSCTDPEADGARVREAMAIVSASLQERIQNATPEGREILQATSQMARDKGIAKEIDNQLRAGLGITAAVASAVDKYAKMFADLGGYMAERITDLYDVRDRLICNLRGLPEPGIGEVKQPAILVAKDLSPAETAVLDLSKILGVVIELGGPTSHTAILCAQLGIPAVVRVPEATRLCLGQVIAVNGGNGEVIVNPDTTQLEKITQAAKLKAQLLADSHGPGKTLDGHSLKLLANIGSLADALAVANKADEQNSDIKINADVEGCGLFRTEFLFIDQNEAPSIDTQIATYEQVLQAFGERRVVVRTLDAGADKPLKFADLGAEENPALGIRGLRLNKARPDLLDTQLRAIAVARQRTGADLWVMAPMVSTVEEVKWFAKRARAVGLPKIGIMIEIPAAAIICEQLLKAADLDFVSIGTNDLAQYTMAADRLQGELAEFNSAWQPAVLRLIDLACQGAKKAKAHVGVCGEAGGDPLIALVLAGIGVKSLSMALPRVAVVRQSLAQVKMETCVQLARQACAASDAQSARAIVLEAVPEKLRILL